MEKLGRLVAAVVLAAAIAGTACWFSGKAAGRVEMQVEAVKYKFAHYMITDELGRTIFEWGPPIPGVDTRIPK